MESYHLFYSNSIRDPASRKFMRELEKQYNINVNFNKICIDNKDANGKRLCEKYLKKYKIKKVPAIIIDTNVYQGIDAFEWLENQIYSRQSMTTYPGLNKDRYQQAPLLRPGQVQGLQALSDGMFPQQQPQQGYQQHTIAGQQTHQPQQSPMVQQIPEFLKPMDVSNKRQQPQMDPTSQMMQERERQNQELGLVPQQVQMHQQPMQQPMQGLSGLSDSGMGGMSGGMAPLGAGGMSPLGGMGGGMGSGMAPVYNPNVF